MSTPAPVCTTEVGISRQVLTVLGMMNIVEGFTMNVIWPFLPFMVESFGVATEETVGLYVGILGRHRSAKYPTQGDCCRLITDDVLLQVPVTTLPQRPVLLYGVSWQIKWEEGQPC